jgi:hypothetical protein
MSTDVVSTDAIAETESVLIDLKGLVTALEIARQHRGTRNAEAVDLVVDTLLPMALQQIERAQESLYAIPTKQPVAAAEEIQ